MFNFIIFIMGSNIVLVKMAQENISPDAFGLFRLLTAQLDAYAVYEVRFERFEDFKDGCRAWVWCAVGYYFQAIGLDITRRVVCGVYFVVYGHFRAVDCSVGREESP